MQPAALSPKGHVAGALALRHLTKVSCHGAFVSGTQLIKVDRDLVLEVQRVRERIHYADAREREYHVG